MNTVILKLSFVFCFICFLGLVSAWSQNGQVPALVDVVTAKKIMNEQVQALQDEITQVEQSGGTVEPNIKERFQLYKSVYETLQSNSPGFTTFSAIAGNSNYKLQKMDDEAYKDLLDGYWDENMTELISILKL